MESHFLRYVCGGKADIGNSTFAAAVDGSDRDNGLWICPSNNYDVGGMPALEFVSKFTGQ